MAGTPTAPACAARGRSAGFSIVELMVAMTFGLLVTAGVLSVLAGTSGSHREVTKSSRQIENGRYALQVLREDLRHAGFYGELFDLPVPDVAPDACAVDLASLGAGMGIPVQGWAGAASPPLACLPDYRAGTDVLVVRRAATVAAPVDELVAGEIYLQSRPGSSVLRPAVADPAGNQAIFTLTDRAGAPAGIRRYLVHIYYVRPCTDCSDGGDGVPSLARAELSTGTLSGLMPIAEGVEALELRYGIDDSGNGAPDRLVSLPASIAEWSDVVTVEAALLVRQAEPTAGYQDRKVYRVADADVGPLADGFKRHVFSTMARVVNPSSRREQ